MKTSRLSRRALCMAALCASGLLGTLPARAQAFPSKPIRLVIPAPPGGSTDTIGRVLGRVIQEQTGTVVVIDNKVGASGSIGVLNVVRSPADGYTILLSVPDAVTIYPLVNKDVPYRGEKDLTPITLAASTYMVYAIEGKSPAKTLAEFLNLAKGGQLNYATQGAGTTGHLMMEQFKSSTGAKLTHVPYKGIAPAMMAVMAGETSIIATSPASLRPFLASGQLKAVASTRATRAEGLPNLTTMAESGYPDVIMQAWFGVFAPPNLNEGVADKLNEIILAAIRSPEFRKQADNLNLEVQPVSRHEFGKMLTADSARWKTLVDSAKIRVDE